MSQTQFMFGPTVPFSEELHAKKYRSEGETFREAMNRIAAALKDDDKHFHEFKEILLRMRFMPAGRIQTAIGSTKQVTPYNCLGPDTPVLTQEYGSVPIRTLAGQTATVLDGNRQWVRAAFASFGIQTVYAVTFANQNQKYTVLATQKHDWVDVSGKRVSTGQLKASRDGYSTRIEHLTPEKSIAVEKVSLRHGYVYGDRTVSSGGFHVRICSDHADITPLFDGLPVSYPASMNGDPVYYLFGDNTEGIDMKSLPTDTSYEYISGFIRGWLAADGCVCERGNVTICCGPNEEEWLKKYGPIAGFYITGSSELLHETNYGVRKKKSRNVRFDARSIAPEDIIISRKRDRLVEHRNYWAVTDISGPVEDVEVFCAQVPSTHSFALGNGIHTGNCFVVPVDDSFVDGDNSIMQAAMNAATTMRMGGGVGYDFSRLRPRGALIKKLLSTSSGPISFMEIFDAVCRATCSSGHRRGAQMGILRVDHPDIEEFINAKNNEHKLTGFNISIAVTDEFMAAVYSGKPFPLRFGGETSRFVDAAELWETIMRSTWDWAEPGVIFIDQINRMNNLYYCETLSATNPCSEQPLPDFGACLLGSFNLVKYLSYDSMQKCWAFDYGLLEADIPAVVRAMDNVVDRAVYPLQQQRHEAISKRRMGLGITGLANTAEALGYEYGTLKFLQFEADILRTIANESYRASAKLAKEKGSFPALDVKKYLKGNFIKGLDSDVQELIARYGVRNSHLTSIAPTGTISLCADNVSSGIEPVFDYQFDRTVIEFDGPRTETIQDYGVREFGVRGKRSKDVTAKEHIDTLINAQKYVDSAVSKTCNVTGKMPWTEFKQIYMDAWLRGAKGCSIFNENGKRRGVLVSTEPQGQTCEIINGKKSCE